MLVAGAAWVGVSRSPWCLAGLACGVFFLRHLVTARKVFLVGLALVAGTLAGLAADRPPHALSAGSVSLEGSVRVELDTNWGWAAVVQSDHGRVLIQADEEPDGEWIAVDGVADGVVRRVVGRWVASTVDARRITTPSPPGFHRRAADAMRERIVDRVNPTHGDERALLLGFLVGDTRHLSSVTSEEMRRAGLSHLVAVSGSNVALFLTGLAVMAAPLAIHPAGRVFMVVNGLLMFGTLTRWEPSVIRASAMAGLVSVGRFVGVPFEPATALAIVAGSAVIIDPSLARAVGFQLSVVATAGLLIGARLVPATNPVTRLLGATISAQLAVAPLLLAVFGSVPVLSPVANLAAIPLVTVATIAGGVGALFGVVPLVGLASWLAGLVMTIARVAAPWPQVGWAGAVAVGLAAVAFWKLRTWRWPLAVVAAGAMAIAVLPSADVPERGVLFLDVGQGDAIVVELSGFTILVDGGPDPVRLLDRLRHHGIGEIDLVVATHVHADHVAGLTGLLGRVPVAEIWAAFDPHSTPAAQTFMAAAARHGVKLTRPNVGDRIRLGSDTVEVLGPLRRYDGPNDQSIVLLVESAGVRTLLAGDLETAAQAELRVDRVDVLKVPHQGAATSSARWLADHSGVVAVVSVGPNMFGHPAEWVIRELETAGARVYRTDRDGDVVVDFEQIADLRG